MDMEVELPARLGFPLLPRVPVRSTTDGSAAQQAGHGILNLSAAAQQRLPRLLLVVDTNVLMCSVARRVVAAIGTLLRPTTTKAASVAGLWGLMHRKVAPRTCHNAGFQRLDWRTRTDMPCHNEHVYLRPPPSLKVLTGSVL